jgi:NADH-quinone oxidoreductase subunit G
MPTVYVNDQPVEIGNQKLNCVQAAELAATLIPHYCYHPGLSVVASCRMCLVEVGELKEGKVLMQPKVLPGCQTPVKDGTVIVTGDYDRRSHGLPVLPYDPAYRPGEKAKKSQADTLEGLLLNHPLDCPVCDKAGECKLQDYSYQFGRSESRMVDAKNQPANKPEISSKITLFTDRCIMCTRCVRFTREIAGTSELQVVGRGHHEEIDVFPGYPLENKLSGNVVDLCPVGALGSKDFLYTQRVWYLKTVDNVCPGCSTGCSIHTDTNKDIVYRLRARTNLEAQGYFMCDEGRWGYHYQSSENRITRPTLRTPDGSIRSDASGAVAKVKQELTALADRSASKVVVSFSPFLSLEEAYSLGKAIKAIDKEIKLVMGPVPVSGSDDHYPKDRKGNPIEPIKFTIRAEKAPNRQGVASVLQLLQGSVISWLDAGCADADGLIFFGGYPQPELLDSVLSQSAKVPRVLLVQDLFASRLTAVAEVVLPATTAFEKEGTFVNHAGVIQPFARAVRPAPEIRTELQVAYDLSGRKSLATAGAVRKELAQAMPQYARLLEVSPKSDNQQRVPLATVASGS